MNKEFKGNLKKLIDKHYKSHNQFIIKFNEYEPTEVRLSKSKLSDILNGKYSDKKKKGIERGIKAELIPKLAKFFGVSADYLLGITGSKTTNLDAREIEELTGISADSIVELIELKKKFGGMTKYYDALLSFLIDDYYENVKDDEPKVSFRYEGLEEYYDEKIGFSGTDTEFHFLFMDGDSLLSHIYNALDLVFYSFESEKKFKSGCNTKFSIHYEEGIARPNSDYCTLEDQGMVFRKLNGATITYDQLRSLYVDTLKEKIISKSGNFDEFMNRTGIGENDYINNFKEAKGNLRDE